MNRDTMNARGHFLLLCLDEEGELKWKESIDNDITNAGFDFLLDAGFVSSSRPAVMSHVGIGSGTTGFVASQTALATQLARESGTYAHTAGSKIATMSANFSAGTGTGTVGEVGVFNAATGGTMLSRALLATAKTKDALDTLTVTYTLTLSQQ